MNRKTDRSERWGSTAPAGRTFNYAPPSSSERRAGDEREKPIPMPAVEAPPATSSPVLYVSVPPTEPRPATVHSVGRLRIRHELFDIGFDDDMVYVTHPRWSLLGSGPTLRDAEIDLVREAAELAEVMADMEPSLLDRDARQLRAFVLQFLGTTLG